MFKPLNVLTAVSQETPEPMSLNLTSICLSLKTPLMLELNEAPENIEVMGYVRSSTFLNTDVISCITEMRNK